MIKPRRDPEILLRRYWEEPDTPIVTAGLSLLSAGYRSALAVRNLAYRCRVLRTGRLPCPVISVGNVTLGGSGKTPMVELIVRALKELDVAPAVVSRGYGRETRGVHVVADQQSNKLGPRAAGDEPFMLAERLPGVVVVVGENRFDAGRVAVERGATAVVLDDGFQHRTVEKDLEILVLNGRAPWGNARLFPRGMLREPLPAMARADLIAITNPPSEAAVEAVAGTIRRYNERAPLLVSSYEVVEAQDVRGEISASAEELAGRRLLAFAGLGSPQSFADTLDAMAVRVAGLMEYPDHHWFAQGDLDDLAQQSRAVGAEGLITTEKDWARLRGLRLPAVPLWVLAVRVRLDAGRELLLQALAHALSRAATRRS